MGKLYGLERGEDPRYISSYMGRVESAGDLAQYDSPDEIDLEKTQRLMSLKQKYGSAVNDRILAKNMELFGQTPRGMWAGGRSMLQTAQDQVIAELEVQEQMGQNRGLRSAYSKTKKNPMLFGG